MPTSPPSTIPLPCQVLEDSGMPMDEVQYSLLATKIGFRKEGMSYLDFAVGFEGTGGHTLPRTCPAGASRLLGPRAPRLLSDHCVPGPEVGTGAANAELAQVFAHQECQGC